MAPQMPNVGCESSSRTPFNHLCTLVFAPLGLPKCNLSAIRFIGSVVSALSPAAIASLDGSLRRRVAKSDSVHLNRRNCSCASRSALASAVSCRA